MAENFETFDAAAISAMPAFKQVISGPDETWTSRIANIGVGAGFRVHREEGESARQVKRRVNGAAAVHFKELMWKPEQVNLAEGAEPTSWVVKVKSLNLKAKAEAEAKAEAKNRQNGPSQPAQPTTSSEGGQEGTPERATASGPRRPS